jgi:DNA-binding SARP family transcriptional activator/WD40 repeat protein/energy-coupling factor transporter ATP-binding protein EcfA2
MKWSHGGQRRPGRRPYDRRVRVRVLGHIEVESDSGPASLGGPVHRRLLGVLVAHRGHVVSVDALADALWGGAGPAKVAKTIQVYMARLRARLPAGLILTQRPGYRLAGHIDVDAYEFEDLTREAQRALAAGRPAEANGMLEDALALWRGEPFEGWADYQPVATEARRLEEVRLAANEARIEAGLSLGRHHELVADARALCSANPLREHLWVLLITALFRCGRQAEALAAYQDVRRRLADELGVDPGEELRRTERQVLSHDPALLRQGDRTPLPAEVAARGALIGRTAELAWLREWWQLIQIDGGHHVLLLSGAVGSGRSRLLAQFASELWDAGIPVSYNTAPPSGGGLAVVDGDVVDPTGWLSDVDSGITALTVVMIGPESAPERTAALRSLADEARTLEPLARDEVAELIALVGDPDEEIVDRVVAATHGWPGRVITVAAEIITERTAGRVADGARRAPQARRDLATAREAVATGVVARLRAQRSSNRDGALPACPYKGLASYEEADADLFFGRDESVAAVCGRLVDNALVAVVGPSGSGKSSLVRAGVLPALSGGALPGLADARARVVTPGARPLDRLEREVVPAGATVLVVDQFEELFTMTEDEAVRAEFIRWLLEVSRRPGSRVILTIRGDYVGACGSYRELAELVGDASILIGPMRNDEIRAAVREPAHAVGLDVEPELVELVVGEVAGQPAALPLMSTALVEAWERRNGRTLTAAGYLQGGAVSGALARSAEAAYARLDGAGRRAARAILLRLADSDDPGALLRRRVPRAEFGRGQPVESALRVLAQRRLITVGGAGVEVAHEALFQHWPRLAGWLAEDGQGRALRRHLGPAALEWDATGRPESELYRGARLATAVEWVSEGRADLSEVEEEFLEASREYGDRERRAEAERADREARGRRRLSVVAALAAVLLVLTTAATAYAIDQWRSAADASRQAQARRLAAQALVEPNLDRSALLAVAAVRLDDSWQTRGALLAVLSRTPRALGQVRGVPRARIQQIALTPDGRTLVAGDNVGNVLAWDASTLEPVAPVAQAGEWSGRTVPGPDENTVIISAGGDQVLWDAQRGVELTRYRPPNPYEASPEAATTVAGLVLVRSDTELLFYDAMTGQLRSRRDLPGPGVVARLGQQAVVLAADGTSVTIYDPVSTEAVRTLPLPAPVLTSGDVLTGSLDGTQIAVIETAGSVVVLDAATGVVRHRILSPGGLPATVAFSPDARSLALGTEINSVQVWDLATGDLRWDQRAHTGSVHSVVFAPDGRTLFSSSLDNSVIAWDLAGDRTDGARRGTARFTMPPSDPDDPNGAIPFVNVTADGGVASLGNWRGQRLLVDTTTGEPLGETAPPRADVGWVADDFAAGRRYVGTTHGLLVTDLRTGAAVGPPPVQTDRWFIDLRLSRDGRRLAVVTVAPSDRGEWADFQAAVLDTATLQPVGAAIAPGLDGMNAVWPNHDGSLVMVTDAIGTRLALWDVAAGRADWSTDISPDWGAQTATFAPDGRTVAVGSRSGGVVLFDRDDGRVLRRTDGIGGFVRSVQFSPDGAVIAVAGGNEGSVRLLATADLALVGIPLGGGEPAIYASFTPDGATLRVLDASAGVSVWSIGVDDLVRRACAAAHRELTEAEWQIYLPDSDFRTSCRS